MVNAQNSRILIGNIERLCLLRTSKINATGEIINTIFSASVTRHWKETSIENRGNT